MRLNIRKQAAIRVRPSRPEKVHFERLGKGALLRIIMGKEVPPCLSYIPTRASAILFFTVPARRIDIDQRRQ
jgi:hypothetical protein